MKYTILAACSVCFGSFLWGMLRFFSSRESRTWHAAAISFAGLVFLAWHLWSIATSPEVAWRSWTALSMYGSATSLFWWAVRSCRDERPSVIGQKDVPQWLLQNGPYRHIRHPFYTAYSLAWSAGLVATGNHALLVSVAMMIVTYVKALLEEEAKFGRSPLAAEYRAYKERAGAMWPRCHR